MQKGDWGIYRRLLGYVARYWFWLIFAIIGFLIGAGAEAFFLKQFGALIDLIEDPVRTAAQTIPLLMLGATFARAIGQVGGIAFISKVSFNVIFDLRRLLFTQLLSLPSGYFDKNTQGHVVSRLTFTVAQMRDTGTEVVRTLLQDGAKVVVFFTAMLLLNWQMTLVFVATVPMLALVVVFASKRFRRISRRIQNSMGDVTHVVSEAVSGYREVRIFGGQTYEDNRFMRANKVNRQQNLKMAVTKVTSAQLNETVISVAICVLIYVLLGSTVQMSSGDLVVFLGYAALLGRPVRKLSEVNAKLQRGLAAAEDVFTQLDAPLEADQGERKLEQARGALQFENVSFGYADDAPVISNVNLTIQPGQTVALVGRSGSGKTTLASLIPRFYETEQGRILLDGVDIREYQLAELRAQIALVSQQVTLFNTTLRNNIAYGDLVDADEQDIRQAMQRAHANEFVDALPEGLDTIVGDDGVLLSGGQRQRVAMARALLKDAPILILDEATSALDNESERHIQAALEAVMEGRTTIVIAHRLSTVESADVIVVLEDGSIVESGDHQSLLDAGGAYAELYAAQFEDDMMANPAGKKRSKRRSEKTKTKPKISSGSYVERSSVGISRAWYQGAWWLHLLRPLSWVYRLVSRRKAQAYQSGKQMPGRTSLPVIVVGNITAGGTGKTPLVSWLVDALRGLGFRPGIVLRGYGGTLSQSGSLVPGGADAERYGDEAVLLRERLHCPVAICADRVKALQLLETQDVDIAVSDDGLQHYAMARDIEIAVIDGARGIGNGLLLPAGPLREPLTRLQQVDWVIANGQSSQLHEAESVMSVVAECFVNLGTNEQLDCAEFAERYPQVHAVCGIANPERFFRSLHELEVSAQPHSWPDHHPFDGSELSFDDSLPVVCTEKDAAKISHLEQSLFHIWYLRVAVVLPEEAHQQLQQLLQQHAIAPCRAGAEIQSVEANQEQVG